MHKLSINCFSLLNNLCIDKYVSINNVDIIYASITCKQSEPFGERQLPF